MGQMLSPLSSSSSSLYTTSPSSFLHSDNLYKTYMKWKDDTYLAEELLVGGHLIEIGAETREPSELGRGGTGHGAKGVGFTRNDGSICLKQGHKGRRMGRRGNSGVRLGREMSKNHLYGCIDVDGRKRNKVVSETIKTEP